jgi:CRISPR-associated protein Csb2
MPTIKLTFPGGRYHATPHGFHVNEGQVEWPPSPWRVIRALLAVGFTTQHWGEVPIVARSLIEKLSRVLPQYRLPEATAAHSRHFMPLGVLDKGREKTTLVLDTWADVSDGELLIHWDCTLDDEETNLLKRLVDSLGYLGRSESWVEGQVVDDTNASEFNACPYRDGERRDREWQQITVTAAIPSDQYTQWRQSEADRVLAKFPLPEGKKKPPAKLVKEREKSMEPYPPDLIECMMKETAWWKSHGWGAPPGSQSVLYWRQSDCFQVGTPTRSKPAVPASVTTMLLALTTPTGNKSALPSCTLTLPQAELFHRAVVGRVGKGQSVSCPELTGRDEQGQPLRDSHRHAHVLPVDLDGDGHLDHILIHAPMGLGSAAQRAIRTLRRTWTKGGVGNLQVALAGSGDLNSLRSLREKTRFAITGVLGSAGGSSIWSSLTPFIPPRYLKRRGSNSIEGQIKSELASRGVTTECQIEILSEASKVFRHFVRVRKRGGQPPPHDLGFAIRLRFETPVLGPLALGYASHFGMGMFRAEQ